MMNIVQKAFGIGVCCFSPVILAATPVSGLYMKVGGGVGYLDNIINAQNAANSKFKTGYAGLIAIGSKNGPFSYELEGHYLDNKLKSFQFQSTAQTATSGYAKLLSGMLNIGYEFSDGLLAPSVSVGIGYTHARTRFESTSPNSVAISISDTLFTYQGSVGLQYNVTEKASFALGYQYMRTQKSDKLGKALQAHTGLLSVIYRFETY